jgi:hypothetical protein
MITKIYEFYKMLTEKAFNVDDTKNCILIRNISKKEVKLCLYNYVDKTIIGYITADDSSSDKFMTIDRISADKGWGPFMYMLMLQQLYPMGVKPSHIIKPEAHSIWKQFAGQPNVITEPLPQTDTSYTTKWEPAKGFSNDKYVEEDVEAINTIFYMEPLEWFQPFLIDSDRIIAEQNINTKNIFKQCLEYFYSKYYVTTENNTLDVAVNVPTKDITDKYLIVHEKGASIQLMIQNKSQIYGYAEVLKRPGYYQIVNIAAEPGWGPFLYDTVMLSLDKPVRPNHSLTTNAWRVWNTYMNQRDDVMKKPVTTDVWDDIDLDQKMSTKSSLVEPLNYLYTIKDNERKTETTDWQDKSNNEFVNQMTKVLPDWKEKRFNQGKMYFNTKYPMYK